MRTRENEGHTSIGLGQTSVGSYRCQDWAIEYIEIASFDSCFPCLNVISNVAAEFYPDMRSVSPISMSTVSSDDGSSTSHALKGMDERRVWSESEDIVRYIY